MDMETLADPLIFLPILLYYPFLHLLPLRGDSFTVSTDISFCFKYHLGHSWSKNIQIITQKETDMKGWSSNLIANDVMLACDLDDIKLHPHLHGHQTIQPASFTELFDATSLSTSDYCFQAPNSCRDLSRGWKNQLNLGLVPDVANRGSASSK